MAKNILFIDQYNKPGGGQSVLINLVLASEKIGMNIRVCIPHGNYIKSKLYTSKVTYDYINPIVLTNSKKTIIDFFKLVKNYFLNYKIIRKNLISNDIIYINGSRYFFLALFFSFFFRKKYYYHFHTKLPKLVGNIFFQIAKNISNSTFIFTSDYLNLTLLKYQKKNVYTLYPSLTYELSNNLFINRFTNSNADCIYNFVCVGRIIPEKGQNIFIELASIFSQHKFYIVGEPEFDTLDYFTELKNNSTKNVEFCGGTDSIYESINKLEVHFSIVPSQWEEPFGMVAIESMAMSCITFISNKGGLSEIIKKTGAIEFNNLSELIDRVSTIINLDSKNKLDLAKSQFLNTMKDYSFINLCKQFETIIF